MSSQSLECSVVPESAAKDCSINSDGYSQAIFDHVLDCITVAQPGGQIEYVNAAACKTFGYSREEFLRKGIPDLIAATEFPRLVEWLVTTK